MLLIDVPDEEVVAPPGGRRTCDEEPSHVYHVEFDPPKKEGVCDIDGSAADRPRRRQARGDPATASTQYHEKTEPLIDYYDERGILQPGRTAGAAGRGRGRDPRHPRDAAPRGRRGES